MNSEIMFLFHDLTYVLYLFESGSMELKGKGKGREEIS